MKNLMFYKRILGIGIILAELMFVFLAVFNRLAIASSRFKTYMMFFLTVVFYTVFNIKKRSKNALLVTAVLGFICLISMLTDPRERWSQIRSPRGETTIIIEYDYASRPHIYRKENIIFMSPVPFSFGPGYNETVQHEIVWMSERQIKLTDPYGTEWVINVKN